MPVFTSSCSFRCPGLVMLQDIPTVNWSRTYFRPHRLARGAGEMQASWRHGQPRSRQTWSSSPDRDSSATHDGERSGWTSLVSSHSTTEPGVPPSVPRLTQLVKPTKVQGSTFVVPPPPHLINVERQLGVCLLSPVSQWKHLSLHITHQTVGEKCR